MSVIPQENNYSSVARSLPSYKFRKVQPVTNVASVSRTSSTEAVYELPSVVVMNLAKSFLSLKLTIPKTADRFIAMLLQGRSPFSGVRINTEKGVELLNVQDLQSLQRLVAPVIQDPKSWLLNSAINTEVAVMDAKIAPIDGLVSVLDNGHIKADGVVEAVGRDYWKPKEIYIADSKNTDVVPEMKVPLNQLVPHSVLSLVQDLYFGEKITLTLTFAPTDDWVCHMESRTSTGPMGSATVASDPALSEFTLFLAVQDNPAIANQVQQQVLSSGIHLPFAQPVQFKQSVDASTSFSTTCKLNISKGRNLLRIYHGLFRGSLIGNKYNLSNYNAVPGTGTAWTAVRSYLNAMPESDYNLNPKDAYIQYADHWKATIINSQQQFDLWGGYMRDYSGMKGHELFGNEHADAGLSLALPVDWMVEQTKDTNTYTAYTWAIVQKVLHLTPNGAEVTV